MTTTLLAVDDSRTMRRVLEITFSGEDEFRTILAQNAGEALEKLRGERPNVVLVDANLGEESGYTLCEQIKKQAPDVAVVVLSSKQQPYDRTRGSAAGADDFIDKPFDTQQLIEKVGAVLQSKKVGQPVQPAPAARSQQADRPRPAAPPYGATLPGVARPAVQDSSAAAIRPVVSVAGTGPIAASSPKPAPGSPPTPMAAPGRPAVIPASSFGGEPRAPVPSPSTRTAAKEPPPPPAAPATLAPEAPKPAAAAGSDGAQAALVARLKELGLSKDQVEGVLVLSREVIEQVVWEVVPVLAETMIEEEIRRLTSE